MASAAVDVSTMSEDEQIELALRESERQAAMQQLNYEIAAIVCHSGETPYSGHYVTWTRRKETKSWVVHNDSQTTEREHLSPQVYQQAYLLFYVRR